MQAEKPLRQHSTVKAILSGLSANYFSWQAPTHAGTQSLQAAEAEISDDVLDEFIYEPTSRPSSNRTPAKRSPKPIRNSRSLVRSALTGAQLRH